MNTKPTKRNFSDFSPDIYDDFTQTYKKQACEFDPMEIDTDYEDFKNINDFVPEFNPLYGTFEKNCQPLNPANYQTCVNFSQFPSPTLQIPKEVRIQIPQQSVTQFTDQNKKKGLFANRSEFCKYFELVIDLANLIHLDYCFVRDGGKLSAYKFDDLLQKLSEHTNIQIVSIVFCTKHHKTGDITDKYYDCVKRWVAELENVWHFQQLGVSVNVNICEYEGISKNIDTSILDKESDDTGLIVTQLINNSKLLSLLVSDDRFRSMKQNVENLQDLDANIVIRTCDPQKESVSRDPKKMDFETFSIKARDFIMPSIINVFNYRNGKFLHLFPNNPSQFKITCSHAISTNGKQSISCSCLSNNDMRQNRYNSNKKRTANKSRSHNTRSRF